MFVLINRHGTRRCGGFFAIRLFFSVCPFSLKIMFVEDLWLTIYTRFVMNDLWRKVVSMMKKKCMITFYIPTPHRYPNHEAKKELYIHLWQYTKRPLFFFFFTTWGTWCKPHSGFLRHTDTRAFPKTRQMRGCLGMGLGHRWGLCRRLSKE